MLYLITIIINDTAATDIISVIKKNIYGTKESEHRKKISYGLGSFFFKAIRSL